MRLLPGWYFNSVGQPCSADDADGKATVTLDKAAKTLNVELTEGGIVAGTVFTLNVGFAVNGPDYDDYVRFTFEVGVTDLPCRWFLLPSRLIMRQ